MRLAIMFQFWLNLINQGGKIHMVIHSFSVNDVMKIPTRKICTKKVTMKHSLMKSSSPIAKM